MHMTQSLSQRMEQKLVMTRQMIQSIEMLQLPLAELEQNISQELAANPWLELQDPEPTPAQPAGTPPATPEPEAPPRSEADLDPRLKRMEALVEEWNDPATRSTRPARQFGDDDAKLDAMANTAAPGISLEEHLLQQLHLIREEPRLKQLAEVIIGSLDHTGYLRTPLMDVFYRENGEAEEAVVDEQVTAEEAELALELVQGFDPPGVGARDLRECLLLQMARLGEDLTLEEKLVRDFLDDLSHNRLPKVAKELGVTVPRVKEGLARIAHLNPNPGRGFGGGRPQYVVPDVVIEEVDGEFHIRVNEYALPALRISRESLTLLRSEPKDSTVREYILGRLGSAVWLMEAVVQRRHTLYRIAQQIVEVQRPFFEDGPSHLKPLMMQEIAERIGMHVSTVSRALAGKYMQTPQGLFPMKYFFTSGFKTGDGEDESNRAIMLRIQEMVKAEPKGSPLSDEDIMRRLEAEGIAIARRTVAKYREKLNIPSSHRRKTY